MQKSFKFFVTILAVLIIVPQITFASWWNPTTWGWLNSIFHFQQTTQKQEQKQAIPTQNTQTQTAKTDATKIIDWKTYDRGDGFEFKYPNNWIVDTKTTTTNTAINVWSSEVKLQESTDPKNAGFPPIYSEFTINYQSLDSFNQFAKGLVGKNVNGVKDFVSSYGYFGNYAEINVGGQKAYAVISVANRAVYTIYIEVNNRVYVLAAEDFSKGAYDPKNPQIDENVKKIVSTFKFTTLITDQAAGWKTYTNNDYGFQIQYPNGSSVNESYTNGGIIVTSSLSNKKIVVEADNRVLGGAQNPPSCDTASGADTYYKNINGVGFTAVDMSRLLSGNVSTSATQYCVLKDGSAYKIIPQIQYGNTGRVNVNNDAILNQMISTFELTK